VLEEYKPQVDYILPADVHDFKPPAIDEYEPTPPIYLKKNGGDDMKALDQYNHCRRYPPAEPASEYQLPHNALTQGINPFVGTGQLPPLVKQQLSPVHAVHQSGHVAVQHSHQPVHQVQPHRHPSGDHTDVTVGTVQQYHSLFIKEGLKMKVKEKLKAEEPDNSYDAYDNYDYDQLDLKLKNEEELTPEDEERRRRRRERNKIAATKCRNKKKEKTVILISESEVLENQNLSLKQDISRLEAEKRQLVDLLSRHEPTCVKRARLSHPAADDSNNFRIPDVPPPASQASSRPRFTRQESLLATLEMLNSMGDHIADYAAEAVQGSVVTDPNTASTTPVDVQRPPSSYDGRHLDDKSHEGDETIKSSAKKHKLPSSSSSQTSPVSSAAFPTPSSSSCSFSRATKPNYFLVNSPKSLSSYSATGFQLDNRCIAL